MMLIFFRIWYKISIYVDNEFKKQYLV